VIGKLSVHTWRRYRQIMAWFTKGKKRRDAVATFIQAQDLSLRDQAVWCLCLNGWHDAL
jgi:4-alpha-glucanotransferase